MKTMMAISLALIISLILYAASLLIHPSHYKIFVVAFVFGLSCTFLLRYKK